MKTNIKVIFVLLLLLLGSCASPSSESTSVEEETSSSTLIYSGSSGLSLVYRVEDVDMGVICYVFSGLERGGISCLQVER